MGLFVSYSSQPRPVGWSPHRERRRTRHVSALSNRSRLRYIRAAATPRPRPAVRSLGLRAADPPKRVFAGAVEFPSAENAHAFVRTSAGNWKACAGQTVTVADGNRTTPWTFSELNGAPPRIMLRRAQAVPNGRVCQRVLSAVSRVVIDVVACGTSITNEAGQVAEQMAAKVTP